MKLKFTLTVIQPMGFLCDLDTLKSEYGNDPKKMLMAWEDYPSSVLGCFSVEPTWDDVTVELVPE